MKLEDILSGNAGLAGIHSLLHGQSSRRLLRSEAQTMLRQGYSVGPFHLTRAKFKPGRHLLAYFNFPALDAKGQSNHFVHLAVAWQRHPDDVAQADGRDQLQEEANKAGLMPVQQELWREIPEQGLKLQVWPLDTKFPHLVRLGDSSYVARMLASLGIADDLEQLPVITPIRYRPGERHVLRYEISSPDQGRRLYAKLYSNTQDAAKAFGVANRVVDWLVASNDGLRGVKPETMSEEDNIILYPHAPGIPLSHQFHRSRRWVADQLRKIGNALAILHDGPEALQADLRQNDFTKEAKVVRRASEHIQTLLPDTYNKIIEIVDRAEEQYFSLPQEKPTFTHADFKSDHLLTTPQGLTLIDFDTCTLTDPALDLGKFLADLEWWFTLRGISGVETAQSELLKGYSTGKGSETIVRERLERARLFHVLILVKIVARRVPIYKKDWASKTEKLIARAAGILQKTTES